MTREETTLTLDEAPFGGNPYLEGNFAPVGTEMTIEEPLPMTGSIPPELEGILFRNGPNPTGVPDPKRYHWFSGDGMIHAIELRDGVAISYRNRWVRTRKLSGELGTPAPRGPKEPINGPANTNIVYHAGRLLALVETGFPHRLNLALDTLGVEDFDGMLTSPMTAHPKIDPTTGAMSFFGYDLFGPPFLRYHEVNAKGALVHSTDVVIPQPVMIHDFGVSATKVAFLDLPVLFDYALAAAGAELPFRFDGDIQARVGVMDRGASGKSIHWLKLDPCYVFHVMNAFDDGPTLVLDVVRYEKTFDTEEGELIGSQQPTLQRWRLEPGGERVNVTELDDTAIEFPTIDATLAGLPYRYGYCTELDRIDGSDAFVGLVRYDLSKDETKRYDFGPNTSAGEPIFVRSPDGHSDDEGWILTVVYDHARDASDLVILDASKFSGTPEAVIHLPARVPFGFHGNWVSAAQFRA